MHTKGPWELAPCSNGGFILRRGDTHGKNKHPQSHLQIVPEGDARLIAAAPYLLDAIDYALHMLLSLPSGIDEDADENDTSPDDMVAHVGGLIFRKLQAAKSEAEGV